MAPPGGNQTPEMPKMPNMWPMLIMMVMIFGLYFIDQTDFGWDIANPDHASKAHNLGVIMDFALGWLGFKDCPILSLMIIGAIMVTLSSILRTLLTDTIAQRKGSEFSKAFNNEMRQARIENNTYKMKKLTEMQPQVMAKSMEASAASMKSMPWTMLIVVPMFLWVRYFVGVTLGGDLWYDGNPLASDALLIVKLPWGTVNLMQQFWIFPAWILMYSMVSIPIGQFVSRMVRYNQFKKRLEKMDAAPAAAEPVAAEPVVADNIPEAPVVVEEPINPPAAEPPLEEKPITQNEEPPKEGS